MDDKKMNGRTVVITGASSGAGRAAALAFARNGAKLVLAARREAALAEVVAECNDLGAKAIYVVTDVADAEAVRRLAKLAMEYSGRIDVWVNNAGVLAAGTFDETPLVIHERVIRINLMGYIHGAHAVLPYFKEQGFGILINNISVGGWFPTPYAAGYAASKFGLRGFSEALKGELSSWPHIHVCDLYPAFLDTPGMQHSANYTGHAIKPAPPVYDPQRVAEAMVRLAQHPSDTKTVGAMAGFLRLAHALFPGLSRRITAKTIEGYLQNAGVIPVTPGNLMEPVDYGTSIHGGWNSPADEERRRKSFTRVLVITGVAAGLFFFGRRN